MVDASGNLSSSGASFNPSGGGPAIKLAASTSEGDIAVATGTQLSVGHVTTGNVFDEKWRMTSAGLIDAFSGLSADGINMSSGNMTLTITNNATSSQSEPMRITTSSAHPLGVNRLVFRGTSSRDYKTEISPLPDSDEILNNQPVTFHDKFSREVLGENSILQIGMIAEDFSETGPISDFYTVRDESDKITGIQYDLLSTALISAGRSLRSRIEALEARVAELEA